MAIKTFTAGEILTAADTNTYLANSGLVYVTHANVGVGVASVSVTSAFNSTYDAYQIIYSGGSMSADTNLNVALGTSTSSYYGTFIQGTYTGATITGVSDNNHSLFSYCGGGDPFNGASAMFTLNNPFLARQTYITAPNINYSTLNGIYNGRHAASTSFTAFTINANTGTMTGGTVTVYGFRKA